LNKPADPEVDDLREQVVKEAGRKTGRGKPQRNPREKKTVLIPSLYRFEGSLCGFLSEFTWAFYPHLENCTGKESKDRNKQNLRLTSMS
jgi:hypothetical protein